MSKIKDLDKKIAEWKEKFGGVFQLPVGDKIAYLREPNIRDYKRAFTAMQEDSEIGFGEEMLNALWLDGDAEIKTNDEYFLPARKELTKFLKYEDAEITQLPNRGSIIKIGEDQVEVRVITREDLRIAEKKNPSGKPFVTQEKLFEMIAVGDIPPAFADKNNAAVRFPLYQAIEKLQNTKIAQVKKL